MDSAKVATTGFVSFIIGPGLIPQLLLTIVFFVSLQLILGLIETVASTFKSISKQVTVLQRDTVMGPYNVVQSDNSPNQIYNSMNEINGLEYSYSMYIFITPETFASPDNIDSCGNKQTSTLTTLKHIFHKGSKGIFPLMAPGVFVEGDKNTLRVYMNTTTNWNNYVSIPNIPISKWFHLVVTMKGKFMDVYINGNVSVRREFQTVPKLNQGNVYIMSPNKFPIAKNNYTNSIDFKVDGAIKGMVSRVSYYAYALSYAQIDELLRSGPSNKVINPGGAVTSFVAPPYLRDDWWTSNRY